MTKQYILIYFISITFDFAFSISSNESVFHKNMVHENISIADVLLHGDSYYHETDINMFEGPVLGYLTPWNSNGYEVAKTFKNKMNFISPVWLQLIPDITIAGLHDVDRGWMNETKPSKIVPRVIFDKWNREDYIRLFHENHGEKIMRKINRLLLKTIDKYGFDGIVLEVWSQLGGQANEQLIGVISSIGKALRAKNYSFILVIPPPVYHGDVKGMINQDDIFKLEQNVDYFSLMTYDYSSPQRPGPNSPIVWIEKCVKLLDPLQQIRNKILLGLNFYGLSYTVNGGGAHIINHEFKRLLQNSNQNRGFHWDDKSSEHLINIKIDGHSKTIFYPSPLSLHLRIKLAQSLGTGLSIWEIGQGLNFFYDLL